MSFTLGAATPGASGNALLYLASATALDAQSVHTVMCWYKPKTYNTGGLEHGIFGAGYQSGSWPTWAHSRPQWRFGQDNSIVKLSGLYRGSSYSSAPNTANTMPSTSTWYHVACVVTPGASSMSLDLYINGSFVTTLSASGTSFPTQDLNPILGSGDYDFNPADGSFAAWRAWQSALTGTEIATEMDAAAAVKTGAIIDIDFTSSSASNLGSGGSWGEGGNGSWTYNSTGGPTVTNAGGSGGSTDVDPPPTIVSPVSAVAAVAGQADIAPSPTVVSAVSAVAAVSGQADIAPTGTTVTAVSGQAALTAQADIAGTGTTVTPATAVASVTGQADIAPAATVVTVVCGTASTATATIIDPHGTVVVAVSATAAVSGEADIQPAPTVVSVRTAVGSVSGAATVAGHTAVVAVVAGVAAAPVLGLAVPYQSTLTATSSSASLTATVSGSAPSATVNRGTLTATTSADSLTVA